MIVSERVRDEKREDSAALVAALRAGDPAAFETLFARHVEQLQRVVFGVVKSRETAAELVHDVYLTLWNTRDRLVVHGDVRGYMVRAARNRALDWVARETLHRRWAESVHRDDLPHGTGENDDNDEHERHPGLRAALAAALADMPARQREVCRLRWQEGIGPSAIAERLGVAVKTVETQIHRGLLLLRARLKAPEGI
ncbi:MAG: sigma-70 family RNA polymerase sigma factor [Gemmatimonadetes bacterium]|nr:sigma-70 family RNA polymerase sigma factor [Gemmatimonadota bacterium]